MTDHDIISMLQHTVNSLVESLAGQKILIESLEFEGEQNDATIEELKTRIENLERDAHNAEHVAGRLESAIDGCHEDIKSLERAIDRVDPGAR